MAHVAARFCLPLPMFMAFGGGAPFGADYARKWVINVCRLTLWKRNERRKPKSRYVQPWRKGPPKDIRTGLDSACDRAGIPRVPVYVLRHSSGSQLAMAGANPFAIQKAMGHKDIKTTMNCVDVAKPHIRQHI